MPLNNLVKEYSLQTVSDKTKISTRRLKNLQNKEWDKLQEPQVNGFLQIIEREYNIDLSDLKEEVKSYYKEHKVKVNHNPIDIIGVAEAKSGSKIVSSIVTLVTLAVLAYATWYYWERYNKEQSEVNETNSSVGMVNATLSGVKTVLQDQKSNLIANENNETNSSNSTQKNSTVIEDNSTQQSNVDNNLSQQSTVKANQTHKKFDLTTTTNTQESSSDKNSTNEVLTSQEKSAVKDENNSRIDTILNTKSERNDTNSSNLINNNKSLASAKDTLDANITKDLSVESNIAEENIIKEQPVVQEESKPKAEPKSSKEISKITIDPHGKLLWLGIFNINNGKREVKVISKPLEFMIKGNFAIVTGHNKFTVSNKTMPEMKFKKHGHVYLLVSKDGVKQIDQTEYKKVTKNKAW